MEAKRPRKAAVRKPRSRKNSVSESQIQTQVMTYLLGRKIFCWPVKTVGTYDPRLKIFRKPAWWYRLGVPDIHGFIEGIPFVIELKSATGKLSENQKQFRDDYLANALEGIHIVARSLDEVIEAFRHHGVDPKLLGD